MAPGVPFVGPSEVSSVADGSAVDKAIPDTWARVAKAVAKAEDDPALWQARFTEALREEGYRVVLVMRHQQDLAYDEIFVQQLMNYGKQGDLVIAISGSGNSKNIIKAVDWANRHDDTMKVIDGGEGWFEGRHEARLVASRLPT